MAESLLRPRRDLERPRRQPHDRRHDGVAAVRLSLSHAHHLREPDGPRTHLEDHYDDHPQAFALRNLHRYLDRFQPREQAFAADVKNGTLPSYAFIEPQYFSALGDLANDQHPRHDLREGERLIGWVYDTLRSNEDIWQRCLFVLLYDEHGGFFDHVAPPPTVGPDDRVATASDFTFDRLGLRVPAILVSPWLGRGRVDSMVYDHTSLLATVKQIFKLPAFLTARDAAAHTFEHNFLPVPRPTSDTPANLSSLVSRAPVATFAPDEQDLSEHQRSLLALSTALAGPTNEHDAASVVNANAARFLGGIQAP